MKKEIKISLIILAIILLLVGIIGGLIVGLNKVNNNKTNTIDNNSNISNQENLNNDFSYFDEFKNTEYSGTNCKLEFDKNGKPSINIIEQNEIINEFTNVIADAGAGSTYVIFDFKGKSSNGSDLSGTGTIQYSNVSIDSPITITLKYTTGNEKTFKVYKCVNNQNIISKEEAQSILESKYGTKDKDTENIISYGYIAKVKDKIGNEYYAFRQSWLVVDHTSFLQNIFISLDGKTIKTSDTPDFFEDGDLINL